MHVWEEAIEEFHIVVSHFLLFPISMDIVAGASIINESMRITRTIKHETFAVSLLFCTISIVSLR